MNSLTKLSTGMKYCLFLFMVLTSLKLYSAESPDEVKIYYHLHQATRWAELHHSKKFLFSKQEMEKHLGKLKYSEIKLIKSKFYSEYLHLTKLSRNLENSSHPEIEIFREKIHTKAEKLKIQHPQNWQSEFILVQ